MKLTSKGITPVIAIALLLLITVGAVGMIYTQIDELIGEEGPDTSFLEDVDVRLQSVTRDTSTSFDTMQISLENNDDQQFNLTRDARLEYSTAGEQRIQATGSELFNEFNVTDSNCFSSLGSFNPGDIGSCNTGVEMPSPGEPITIYLVEQGSGEVVDSTTCDPSTSSSTTC